MFDISQLRCFVAVAEELHFGRAANRLNMTQPPLSRQIQVLERVLGTAVLVRTSRSVGLTPAGTVFLPEARRILRLAESAAATTLKVAAGRIGTIRIGFTAASAYAFLPWLLRRCRDAMPGIDVSLKELLTRDQISALATGEIDIGLLRPPVVESEVEGLRVNEEILVAALPRSHPLSERDILVLEDLVREPFIGYAAYEARYFHDLVSYHFTAERLAPNIVHSLAQIHTILNLVRAELGVALVPASARGLRVDEVEFRPVRFRAPRKVELFLTWRRDHENPVTREIIRLVQSELTVKS